MSDNPPIAVAEFMALCQSGATSGRLVEHYRDRIVRGRDIYSEILMPDIPPGTRGVERYGVGLFSPRALSK